MKKFFFNDTATTEIYTVRRSSAASDVYKRQYQNNRKDSKTKGKWYARAIHTQMTETDVLAERIQRNCTVKRSDVLAVLSELVEVMQDELQASHVVKLNGFGLFKIGMRTKPADTAAKFIVSENVVTFHAVSYTHLTLPTTF